MSQLDSHPDNELGANIFDQATERQLLDRGIVFALRRSVSVGRGEMVVTLTSTRPLAEILNRRTPRRRTPITSL